MIGTWTGVQTLVGEILGHDVDCGAWSVRSQGR